MATSSLTSNGGDMRKSESSDGPNDQQDITNKMESVQLGRGIGCLNDSDLNRIGSGVGPNDLMDIARSYLNVPEHVIETYEASVRSSIGRLKFKILEHWRNQNPGPDARKRLFDLLEQARKDKGLISIDSYKFLVESLVPDNTDLTVIQHQLKKCLSKKYKNFLSSDWLPVEDAQYFSFREFYVPIMLEEKIQTPEGAQRGKSVPSLTNAIQEIMQDKTENYTLLMEGEGGSGKSSTMAHMALNWADGDDEMLKQFDLLFYIKLSEVMGKKKTLEEIITGQHEELIGMEQQLHTQLYDPGCQVLLILDGLDEYALGTNTVIDNIAHNISNATMCKTCVIITSRSEAKNLHLIANKMTKVVLATGFDKEKVIQCTTNLFRSARKEKEASIFLEKDIVELLRVPIILFMAYLLHQEQRGQSLPTSKTEIIGEIIDLIIDRKKSTKLTIEEKSRLKIEIGEKAWAAMQESSIVLQKNELSEDVLSSGLLHEIDPRVTARGREKRVTFPHKLFMDYLAAWYICKQDIQEHLNQAFPTYDDALTHGEIIRACITLMKGREEVIIHLIDVLKLKIKQHGWDDTEKYTMSSLQTEYGIEKPYFAVYPSCGQYLSDILCTAKLVVIEELTGKEYDASLPCNADIIINLKNLGEYEKDITTLQKGPGMTTLQRHRDHIIAIHMKCGNPEMSQLMSSLLHSSPLGYLHIYQCYLLKEAINSFRQNPELTFLEIIRSNPYGSNNSLVTHGDLLVSAIKSWNGHSKLRVLNLSWNYLPVSVCSPLLIAIARNCPCLEKLNMGFNSLSGCLGGFLQNEPSVFEKVAMLAWLSKRPSPVLSLRKLFLWEADLQADDIKSLTAASTEGTLQHLEGLYLQKNKLSEDVMTLLLHGLAASVTAGKLQHLGELDLWDNELSEAALTPFIHALLNSLGDRKLKLGLRYASSMIIAPSEHKSADHYLKQIRRELK